MVWKKILLEGDAAVLSDTPPVNVLVQTASAGTASEASRQDHAHNVTVAVPSGDITEAASAAEGTATSLVRSDHVHASPSTWAPSSHALSGHTAATGDLDIGNQNLLNAALDVQTTAPSTPVDGQVYFNTGAGDDHPYVYIS